MNKTKAKRCWLCGKKLQGGHGVRRLVDGHERDLHKTCSESEKNESSKSDNAFGMEF